MLAAALLSLALIASFGACGSEAPSVATVNKPAPEFTLKYHGTNEEMNLSDLRGKVVLVNFWGTWCPPCKAELPDLVSLYNDYRDQDVEFLGVLVHRQPSDARLVPTLAHQYGIEYRYVTGEPEVFQRFGISAVPTTFIIDREGVIRHQYRGAKARATFERDVVRVLEQ